MYDVAGKLLNGVKSMYVNSIACAKVKGSECECFRIDSGETGVYHVPLALQCIYFILLWFNLHLRPNG